MTSQISPRPDVGRGGLVPGYTGYAERDILEGVNNLERSLYGLDRKALRT
jgi:hypothetical protein